MLLDVNGEKSQNPN